MGKLRKMGALELVRRLNASRLKKDEKFAFFLGAGCSVSSGIPSCSVLVKNEWLPRLYSLQKPSKSYEEWVFSKFNNYDPEKPALLYGEVIETLFPMQQERQDEIERICSGKLPGFGYGVLAELVYREGYKFNAIATTNFDNLIADAMYLFNNNHPLVITHTFLVDFIRSTTAKPIIVKLHHDAQLGPCNILDEVGELDKNLQEKFRRLIYDRGLIFIGYGGNDCGVLSMLEELPSDALPYGVYWINPEEPQTEFRDWLEKRNAFWIDSFDFDQFMLIIKNEFELKDPSRVHIDKVFRNYFDTYKLLRTSIEMKNNLLDETKILDEAYNNVIKKIDDPYGCYINALQIER